LILVILTAVLFALIWNVLRVQRNATFKVNPGNPGFTTGDWFLLVTAPVPFLVMFVIPVILHLSPRDKASGRLTLSSAGLSAILFAFGCWVTLRARRDGHHQKVRPMICATLVACIPFALTFLLIAVEFIIGGWSY